MTVTEVKTLPLVQKIQIMEAIWEDLRKPMGSEPYY
jgi:hypothetical protein